MSQSGGDDGVLANGTKFWLKDEHGMSPQAMIRCVKVLQTHWFNKHASSVTKSKQNQRCYWNVQPILLLSATADASLCQKNQTNKNFETLPSSHPGSAPVVCPHSFD